MTIAGASKSAASEPSGLAIVFDAHPPATDRDTIERGVDQHNVAITGMSDYYPLAFVLRDGQGEPRGGVLGDIWGGWLHIKYLWVDRPLRHGGWASRLVAAAEEYARGRGAGQVCLETFSFQARPLYEKLGYQVFSQLDDYPPGHTKYFLRKTL
jgi:GNAT superfamily N-acetyltransferase